MGPEDAQGVTTSGHFSLALGGILWALASESVTSSPPQTSPSLATLTLTQGGGGGGGGDWRDEAVIEQLFVFKGGIWETGNQEARTYLRG